MKATELRLGNLFASPEGMTFMAQKLYYGFTPVVEGKHPNGAEHCLTDIPCGLALTDELLISFDFKPWRHLHSDKSISVGFKKGKIFIERGIDGWFTVSHFLHDGKMHFVVNLKFAHELQNLMFSLSGEELKLDV